MKISMLSCTFTVQLIFTWSLLTTRRLLRSRGRSGRVQTRVLREGVPRRRGSPNLSAGRESEREKWEGPDSSAERGSAQKSPNLSAGRESARKKWEGQHSGNKREGSIDL
jgi:hypothetical protein